MWSNSLSKDIMFRTYKVVPVKSGVERGHKTTWREVVKLEYFGITDSRSSEFWTSCWQLSFGIYFGYKDGQEQDLRDWPKIWEQGQDSVVPWNVGSVTMELYIKHTPGPSRTNSVLINLKPSSKRSPYLQRRDLWDLIITIRFMRFKE